ncbi:hypothetical protein NDU88_010476 [Pleurodeles waltl]|uniref:Uncharacterized protein n=1 Tax=Pleurodeles waltl TaxID=8319 RepID=A0AAV7QWJ9_PLEWA|nr:hypothetical protein NDU88_010476 [Pleurodeles waltl]
MLSSWDVLCDSVKDLLTTEESMRADVDVLIMLPEGGPLCRCVDIWFTNDISSCAGSKEKMLPPDADVPFSDAVVSLGVDDLYSCAEFLLTDDSSAWEDIDVKVALYEGDVLISIADVSLIDDSFTCALVNVEILLSDCDVLSSDVEILPTDDKSAWGCVEMLLSDCFVFCTPVEVSLTDDSST